jgi:hypothetical protein
MKDHESAFPLRYHTNDKHPASEMNVSYGMTLKQYAAIHLKVPRSGDKDIDGMIRESRKADFAVQAMAGLLAGSALKDETSDGYATRAFGAADALLAEWEKEAGQAKRQDDQKEAEHDGS